MYNPALMAPSPGASKPTIERETPTSAVVNANQSPGMLAAVNAADLAMKKLHAQAGPITIVTAYNTNTSSGQLAFYAERMAKKGAIGIAIANSPEFVAAAPGGKPVFGTNPIAFGIPQAAGTPLTFDMATSAIALFGVLTSKAKGEPLPEGVAYGKDGKWTTDANEVCPPSCLCPLPFASTAVCVHCCLHRSSRPTVGFSNWRLIRHMPVVCSSLARVSLLDAYFLTVSLLMQALDGGAIATFGGHKGAGLALCIEMRKPASGTLSQSGASVRSLITLVAAGACDRAGPNSA